MKTGKILRVTSGVLLVVAAATAGYAVYNAQRTESVLVATHRIPPFTFVQASDFTLRSIPVSAIQSDAFHSESNLIGHMTSVEILPNAQVRRAMLSSDTSLQGLVDSVSQTGSVTFSLTYKPGAMEQFIPPDSYVNLVTPGPNGTMLHADHVLVMKNTGYESAPVSSTSSNQNQSPMIILTLPEATYLSMAQNIGENHVQVLMIPQNSGTSSAAGQLVPSSPAASLTGTNANAPYNTGMNPSGNSVSVSPSPSPTKGAKK